MAAQLMATNGLFLRSLSEWIADERPAPCRCRFSPVS
jgi:hypothetical protein